MRAGTTNRSLPLVRSFRRIQTPQATARPYLPSHLQNLTSVLPSGLMASGPVHRRMLQSSLKLPYIGELWSAQSVSLYVRFPTPHAHEAHRLFFFLISIRLCHFGFAALLTHTKPLHVFIPASSPRLRNCGTHARLSCLRVGLSIIPQTSTTRDVATRRYARNALFK